ncbi:MarR family winged helix-turn-helix transcriptional regulator [Cellulomonas sp. S1-8]|uniref:MarR family winged helix-turn-helix transcriptional regulator n=1 Tax=Cellulomonas sp. S1-8 TaxID=2904790 RepID=UPI0022430A48|nr:MarR family winged helix-turn-helix transcriptional regulator [Cellulomonas sp. S1-8]UZN03601.1 MarR family winged helix-turn-helix transcriptional regulator [Cellulomonas sp. S1-8]
MPDPAPTVADPAPGTDEPAWLTAHEAATWTAYRRLTTLLDAAVAADLRTDSGLSDADYHVLSTLSETPETDWRLRTLADRLLWTRSRLAHQLRRMEARGLVERPDAPGPAGPAVTLTDEGRRVVDAAAPRHVRSVRHRFLDALDPAQQAAFAALATQVVDALGPPVPPPEDA